MVEMVSVKGIGPSTLTLLSLALGMLLFAYVGLGVQSIFYTVIMEWRFKRGLDPASWRSVSLSTFLGFWSGAVVVLIDAKRYGVSQILEGVFIVGGVGLVVGLIMGLLIRAWSRVSKKVEGNSP